MNCDQFDNTLDDLLDGALGESDLSELEAHVEACPRCRQRLADARSLAARLQALPVEAPSDGFVQRALERAHTPKRRRAPGLVAAGFLIAFAASVFTVIYTGLMVEAPNTELSAALPSVSMVVEERRVVNLVFASSSALDEVSLRIDLPAGVELAGYEGRSRVDWRTRLVAGRNVLPLELIATEPTEGQLIARLGHGESSKIFRVFVVAGS
jgi:anti-sigma factor RsiW